MADDAASFTGSIPQYYDQGLGPVIFAGYAADTSCIDRSRVRECALFLACRGENQVVRGER